MKKLQTIPTLHKLRKAEAFVLQTQMQCVAHKELQRTS